MFSHITIGVSDTARARRFYDAVFAPLGLEQRAFDAERVRYGRSGDRFPFFTALIPLDEAPASAGNGSMTAFLAADRTAVDVAYTAAMGQGGTCEGAPGLRPHYHDHYYGAYFRDPDGNKLHVVCHEPDEH